jgi:hypothetical protein
MLPREKQIINTLYELALQFTPRGEEMVENPWSNNNNHKKAQMKILMSSMIGIPLQNKNSISLFS